MQACSAASEIPGNGIQAVYGALKLTIIDPSSFKF